MTRRLLWLLYWLAAPLPAAEALKVEVLQSLPHDIRAFTQGLEWHEGLLYQSTGLYGQSSIRVLNAGNGKLKQQRLLSGSLFGEGITRVGNRLIQLTWKEGRALVWRLPELAMESGFTYEGEGWGLCYDGRHLWMSDGSASLQQRRLSDFGLQQRLPVTLNGKLQYQLNALACVGEHIYANVWKQSHILRIHKASGRVDGVIDATALLPLSGRIKDADAVLNGIAHDPQTGDFYLTGKWWSRLFRVRFVPAD